MDLEIFLKNWEWPALNITSATHSHSSQFKFGGYIFSQSALAKCTNQLEKWRENFHPNHGQIAKILFNSLAEFG